MSGFSYIRIFFLLLFGWIYGDLFFISYFCLLLHWIIIYPCQPQSVKELHNNQFGFLLPLFAFDIFPLILQWQFYCFVFFIGKISMNIVFVYTIFDGRIKLVYRLMRFHVQISIYSIWYTHLFMNIIVEVKQHVKLNGCQYQTTCNNIQNTTAISKEF